MDCIAVTERSQKFKVVYVTARGFSARSFLVRHFQVLKERGYTVYLASSDDNEARDAVQRANIPHLPIPLKANISPITDVLALMQLCVHFIKIKPNIVHAHMSKAGLTAMLAGFICRVDLRVYHNHGMACFSAQGRSKRLLTTVEKLTCSFATEVIFCSESTKEKAIKLGICHQDKARVLGEGTISGVNVTKFSPQNAALESQNLIEEIPTVTYHTGYVSFVGRVVAHKGVDTLIEAWNQVPDTVKSNYTLLIAGLNSGDDLYKRLQSLMAADSSVQYLGRIDNIVGLYGLSNILVLPSWHEGFPYSVLEAQSCGVPAVVTNVTGNQDAVIDGQTGQIVPVNDPQALAKAIERMLEDEIGLERMRNSARHRITEDFDEDVVLKNLLDFYDEKFSTE